MPMTTSLRTRIDQAPSGKRVVHRLYGWYFEKRWNSWYEVDPTRGPEVLEWICYPSTVHYWIEHEGFDFEGPSLIERLDAYAATTA